MESLVRSHEALVAQGHCEASKSLHNMSYRDLTTGQPVFYQFSDRDFEQRKLDLVVRANQSYSWLFAEGYEYFEDFIEIAFAHVGHNDYEKWPAKLKKNLDAAEAATKPFSWFLEESRNHRELGAKLKSIRNRFPELLSIEKSNYRGIDLGFAICLVELLRHVIVHNGGRIHDVEAFIARVFQLSGNATSGSGARDKLALVKSYISQGPGGFRVVMLDARSAGSPFYADRLTPVTDWLPAYSDFIYKKLMKPAYFAHDSA
jgi:hypothetical protein